MNKLRKKINQIFWLQKLSSVKITVLCLGLLFILVFWGTIAQVNEGLFLAQKRFFHSWFFLAGGFIPFPGAQLVLWILFLNLLCAAITHFAYLRSQVGILIIHFGLLIYFVAAFVTFNVAKESQLTLRETAGSNVSSSYHEWELSIWKVEDENQKNVTAFDSHYFKTNDKLSIPENHLTFTVKAYYSNASVTEGLTKIPPAKEPEKNFPGIVLEVKTQDYDGIPLVLYGGQTVPAEIQVGEDIYNIQLRRKRLLLPFVIKLKNFEMDKHPGTEIASRYQSLIEIENEGLSREVLIYMNHPLRYKDYTFYQASYSIDQQGREYSTFAVVKNSGRLLPYIASGVVFLGLLTHFLAMAFRKKKHA